jgi:nucleolar protein 4
MDNQRELDPRSLFVRGLSYEVGDAELNDAFSAVGPVRHAFIIKDGKGGRHKGYGFVTYALQEDAERAVQELHGTELGGRKIKVEGAKKRAPLEERKTKNKRKQSTEDGEPAEEDGEKATEEKAKPTSAKEPAVKKTRQAAAAASPAAPKAKRPAKDPERVAKNLEKHSLVRTVAYGGLTAETINAAITEIKSKGGEVIEEIINPAPAEVVRRHKLSQDGCTGEVIFVCYKTAKDAMAAVASLHSQPIGGGKKNEGKVSLWARQVSGEGLHLKRWRVVVRNLSFNATEQDLKTAFAPAGFVWEVTVPKGADGKARGFGFVGFTCRAHAERGIKAVNGTKIAARPVAVDWAVAKRDYEQGNTAAEAPPAAEDEQEFSERSEDGYGSSDIDSDSDEEGGKRKKRIGQELDSDDEAAAADLAPEEERGMLHSVIGDILGEGDSKDEDMQDAAAEEEDASEEEGIETFSDDDNDDEEESDEEDDSQDDSDAPKQDMFSRKAIENSKSVPNAALERLERRAEQFTAALEDGVAKKAPPPPGASVFVRGLSLDLTKDDVFMAMKTYGYVVSTRLVVDKTTGKSKGTAFVDYRYEDSAQNVVAVCAKGRENSGPGVVIGGKKVEVDLALDSDGARKLAAEKGAAGLGPGGVFGDKRNIYLSKEGLIPDDSAAWEDLSASDKAKRKRAFEEAKTKLRSPNFCVSKTRLNVRNLPRSWDEKKIKALFIAAVKERATKAQPKVVQVKILKEDGPDGAKGEGRSKGIGFVEFDDHEHALCALRQLNNNPKPWGRDTRPIIEFAIDDVRALKKREARVIRTPAEAAQRAAAREEKAELKKEGIKQRKAIAKEEKELEGGESKSKRKLRAERRRMLKERQRAKQGKQADTPTGKSEGGGASPAAGAGASGALKSQRRREQRKKNKAGGATDGAVVLPAKAPASSKGTGANAKKVVVKTNKALNRRKKEDGLVDKLAASAGVAEGRVVKKRRRDTDRVERLAEAYVARTYGEEGGAKGKQQQQQREGGEKKKRWFA